MPAGRPRVHNGGHRALSTLAGTRAGTEMAKELRLDVVASANSKQLAALAAEFEALDREVNKTGKSMKDSVTFSQFLDGQLEKQRAVVRQLGEELKRTGDVDVFANLRSAQKELGRLERYSKDIAKATSTGIETGATEGAKSLGEAFSALPPQAQIGIGAAVAGGITLAAAPIGAAINGALLAGVGLGGVAAGVAGQLRDPQVAAAIEELKTTGTDVLTASTKAFAPILVDAAHNFQDDLLRAEPRLAAAFDRLAPHAANVFAGLEGLASKAAPGFFEALDAAGPILDELGRDLPGVGQAIGTALHAISDGAPGARDGLHALVVTVEALTEATGYTIEGLSKLYTVEEGIGELLKGNVAGAGQYFSDLTTNSHAAADAAQHITEKFKDGAIAAALEATAVERLNGGLSTLIGNQLNVGLANDQFQKGLNDLGQQLDQNSHSIVGNSDAAIQNRDAILALIGQAEQAREAQIRLAGGADASKTAIDQANKSYQDAITKIEQVGVNAGISKTDLDKLAGQYNVDVILAVSQVNNSPLAQLVAPHDVNRYGSAGPPKRARGGPVSAGMPYLVGEQGPELLLPSVSGTIIPNDITKRLTASPVGFRAQPAARPSNGNGTLLVAGNADSLLFGLLQEAVRTGALQLVAS